MPATLTQTSRRSAPRRWRTHAAGPFGLPRSPRLERQRQADALARGAATTAASRRVLVVDDEPAMRTLCRVNLAASGMDVLEAPDGTRALELAVAERPDLILLDVMLPGLSGWDVARELGENPATRDIPIVFLSARADHADLVQGQQAGAVGYVTKPFDPVAIADLVEETIQRIARGEREQLRAEITERR